MCPLYWTPPASWDPGQLLTCYANLTDDGGLATDPDGGANTLTCVWNIGCTGRRPEGFEAPAATGELGEYLARAASLEAASVPAFRRLARELESLGAPGSLVERARLAARDEIRHARVMRELARAEGASPIRPELAPARARTRVEIAIENSVEGCVNETFGAALAVWQSEHAPDPAIREAMRAIADDELSHAELAWDVAAWLDSVSTTEERQAVEREMDAAIASLKASVLGSRVPAGLARAGLPEPLAAAQLWAAVSREAWATA